MGKSINIKLINNKIHTYKVKFMFTKDKSLCAGVIPLKENDKGFFPPVKNNGRKATTPAVAPIFFKGVLNRFMKDLYVPYFKYDYYNPRFIRYLQRVWKLGDLYIFGSDGEVFVMGLRGFSLNRLEKIIKNAKCKNMAKSMIRTSFKVTIFEGKQDLWKAKENIKILGRLIIYNNSEIIGKIIDTEMQPLFIIKADKIENGVYSERHMSLLKKIGFQIESSEDKTLKSYEIELRGKVD